MNVLYYIPGLNRNQGGVYQYSLALLARLLRYTNHNFLVYNAGDNDDLQNLKREYGNRITFPSADEMSESRVAFLKRNIRKTINATLRLSGRRRLKLSSRVDHLVEAHNIQVIHSPTQSIPVNASVAKVVTMHDVQHFHFPEYFSEKELQHRAKHFTDAVNMSDAVIVSFAHVKIDIERFYKIPAEKIFVCALNVENQWFEKLLGTNPHPSTKVNGGFILYPAATWQHKNHLKLLDALHTLINQNKVGLQLVCTGGKTDYYPTIEKRIKELKLEQHITFTGVVDDKELFALYKHASAVVVPTLYEAGSFPLMEALIIGVPVICSNVTSLPETIGDSEFTFDPNNVPEIAEKIHRIVKDEDFRKRNLETGKLAAKKLISNHPEEILNSVYQRITSVISK